MNDDIQRYMSNEVFSHSAKPDASGTHDTTKDRPPHHVPTPWQLVSGDVQAHAARLHEGTKKLNSCWVSDRLFFVLLGSGLGDDRTFVPGWLDLRDVVRSGCWIRDSGAWRPVDTMIRLSYTWTALWNSCSAGVPSAATEQPGVGVWEWSAEMRLDLKEFSPWLEEVFSSKCDSLSIWFSCTTLTSNRSIPRRLGGQTTFSCPSRRKAWMEWRYRENLVRRAITLDHHARNTSKTSAADAINAQTAVDGQIQRTRLVACNVGSPMRRPTGATLSCNHVAAGVLLVLKEEPVPLSMADGCCSLTHHSEARYLFSSILKALGCPVLSA